MPLPERYRCCRKSLPVTEDFLSLPESAAGQNPLFFPVRRKGSEESVKGMVSFMESAFIRFFICCRPWDFLNGPFSVPFFALHKFKHESGNEAVRGSMPGIKKF